MKALFDRFLSLSEKAEGLLAEIMSIVRETKVPTQAVCDDLSKTLADMRETYADIRAKIPANVLEMELPEGEATVMEYQAAWENSLEQQQLAVRGVLEEFLRVYSDEPRYMDAIAPALGEAKALLDAFNAEADTSVDVEPYRLFLEGIEGDLDDDNLIYRLEDGLDISKFSQKAYTGLLQKKYKIRTAERSHEFVDDAVGGDVEEKETVPAAASFSESVEITGEKEESPDSTEEIASEEETSMQGEFTKGIASAAEEPDKAVAKKNNPAAITEEPENPETATQQETTDQVYIHPINPIKPVKMPSDQKLRDLVRMTASVLGYLIDKLVFAGMIDETRVFNAMGSMDKPISRTSCIEALALLERKGYICTYKYDGRNILCFTDLMRSCLQKTGTSQKLRQLLRLKKIGTLDVIGLQDMPLDMFIYHLSQVDIYSFALDRLNEDKDSIALLQTSTWHIDRHYFTVNLSREGMPDLPLRVTSAVDFTSTEIDEGRGLFCYSEKLPDMSGVEDDLHYCLTSAGLSQWKKHEWIAITGTNPDPEEAVAIQPEEQAATETTDEELEFADSVEDNAMPVSEEEMEDVQTAPFVPADTKIEVPEEQAEGLWLDDLTVDPAAEDIAVTEFEGRSACEIAATLLANASSGVDPSDIDMACLIRKLLSEGIRSCEPENMHDQVVEAIVLARLLSTNSQFPTCKALYEQLRVAFPIFKEIQGHSGMSLTNAFASETELTPVSKLCAYIYGMLFPARAHDHLFSSLYKNAFSEYETSFPGMDAVKPLYHKAMEGLRMVPSGFSAANLSALNDSKSKQERMKRIQEQAKVLLTPPAVKMMVHGVPELINLCFGSNSGIHTALQIVETNDAGFRELVEDELKKYCSEEGEVEQSKLEDILDSQWTIAAQKYSSRRMGIKYEARKLLLNAFKERIVLIQEWLEQIDTEATPDIEKLRAIRTDIVSEIHRAKADIANIEADAARHLVSAFLDLILEKLTKQASSSVFATLLRSGTLVIDQGELVLNEALDGIKYAEPWRAMLEHVACTDYDLRSVFEKIRNASPDSELYDNYGQLAAIGQLIGQDPQEYELSQEGLRDVIRSADIEARNFREKLEISYAYNRISENDRERLVLLSDPEFSDFRAFFYDHKAFGCWRAFLNALRAQIREVAQNSMRDVRTQLEHAKAMLRPDESCKLLSEAERLIIAEQNYAVAEDYIHRFRNGERSLPFETNDGTINHFLTFSDDNLFASLYGICERSKDSTLSKFGIRYIDSNQPEGWTTRHREDAHAFLQKWPSSNRSVSPQSIADFCRILGFSVESCTANARSGAACFTLSVKKAEQNLADYRHPISMFGTQMKPKVEVVCLFGKRNAKQLVDDACKLGITSTFIVLLDANLPLKDRQKMAEYFFTQKNVGQASFLVIDRVLALYLAMQSNNERLPALLQCTLPYTIYQPFTNGSGSTADEMFFGRVSELASIRDMNGSSIVYGGRQLGKTALLERAKHLDNNPARNEFAVMTSFKGCKGERTFVDILVHACNEALDKTGIVIHDCSTIRDFASQINRLLSNDKISTLRLLLDETDDFLESISGNSYNELIPLIDLQRTSNRRFKFVLAGLHNVCRAKNATKNNGIFGQLGLPLCIKPLTASDARNLLVRPLRYLGFRVSNESHIDTILTNTNYYPGIIQFFGYTLIQTLATQYTQYYDAARGNPPFELHDDQLASIMNSKDLNNNIKERLRWTLEMDDRYYMLARCITVLYHLNGNDYGMISSGFDVEAIREVAQDMFEIKCLTSLSEKEIVSLLDEMEEMGILSKPAPDGDRYLLRRRSFIDVIGTNLEILEHDIEAYNKETENDD